MTEPTPTLPLPPGLTCQKCSRHDDSLRLVEIPYVISLGVYALPGEFRGRWCRFHRSLYLVFAAAITGFLGFIGFGALSYAPRILIELAKGGKLHKGNNARQIQSLIEAKQQRGDWQSAGRCLETRFRCQDDEWNRQELQLYYAQVGQQSQDYPGILRLLASFAGLICAAAGLGTLTGLLDFFLDDYLFSGPWWDYQFLQPFVAWLPLFSAGLPSAVALRMAQESFLEKHIRRTSFVPVFTGVFTALLFFYSVLVGRSLADFIAIFAEGARLPAPAFWAALIAVLTRGVMLEIARITEPSSFQVTFRAIYLSLVGLYAMFALLQGASDHRKWQLRLDVVRPQPAFTPDLRSLPVYGALLFAGMWMSLSPLAVQQLARVDFLEARQHYYTGWTHIYNSAYDQAVDEFSLAIRLDPYMAEAYEDLAWSHDQLGETELAVEYYLQSIQVNPARASAYYYLAETYYFDGQEALALENFEKVIALEPDSPDAHLGMGWSAYYLDDNELAETSFRKAIELNPTLYEAHLGLGYVYEERGDTAGLIEAYQQAISVDTSPAAAFLYLGIAYYNQNELDLAIDNLYKASARDQEDLLARLYLSLSYFYTGKVDEAAALVKEMIAKDPDWAAPHAVLASIHVERNEMSLAREQVNQALSSPELNDMDRYLIMGALLDTRMYDDALVLSEESLKTAYNKADFYFYQAQIYSWNGRFEQAFEACRQAEAAGAKPAEVLASRGSITMQQRLWDDSLPLLLEAAELDPKYSFAHHQLAVVYHELGKYALAEQAAQEAIKHNRYYLSAYLELASAELELRDNQAALAAGKRAAELSPHYDLPHYLMGIAYLNQGQNRGAFLEFTKFVELYNAELSSPELLSEAEEILKYLKSTLEATG